MVNFLKKFFTDRSNQNLLQLYRTRVDKINSLEDSYATIPLEDLKLETVKLKDRYSNGESLDELLPEAFALVREASKRTLGMRHFDVQLIGGMVIHEGKIAEMRTGEGKTLVATLPAYLNALTGNGVHIVTVNDYLAKRDADWMGQIYDALGLSVSVINSQGVSYVYKVDSELEEEGGVVDQERDQAGGYKVFGDYLVKCTRREAYRADITYGTNNEFGFDYLRDNTVYDELAVTQRGHHYAIVDEIDSILIDEARVPLILSRPAEEAAGLYTVFAKIASQLKQGDDYEVDEKMKAITLTTAGIERAERLLNVKDLYTEKGVSYVHHLETAIRAKALFLKDRDYVMREGQVLIVDSFTGRIQDGRRYSDGLHQAIEAKEGVKVQQESRTMASITYQNYFKFYKKLSGMTGTAETSKEEFQKVYGLDVVVIPTNKPIRRIDHPDQIYRTEKGKFKAIAKKVKELYQKGQPVLIGTVSVEKNELLSAYLESQGVPHQVLNAKKHEQEGMIVAQAGRRGAVTIATNMAGRGVDIKLGGSPCTKEEEEEVKGLGGLFVIGTERHDARRIDNQLRGRCGRQGDPGETQFYIALDDPVARIFGGERMTNLIEKLGIPEDEPVLPVGRMGKIVAGQVEKAQQMVEGYNFDARKHVLSYDDVLSTHRNTIYNRRNKLLAKDGEALESLYQEVLEAEVSEAKLLPQKRSEVGDEVFLMVFKQIALRLVDELWMQHLEVMNNARQSVNLRAYGQREPIVEYKKEGLRLFRELESSYRSQLAKFMSNVNIQSQAQSATESEVIDITPVDADYGRNDKVTVEKDGEEKEIKFKKYDQYSKEGWRIKS